MLDAAKEFTMEAAASASSKLVEIPLEQRESEISKLLSSRVERDTLIGMRCVISLIAKGDNGVKYFADVVKNVTSSNQKIKSLVMIYLVRYAENEPDTALLSINSIQKSLNDKNPRQRARAIRSLVGIRINEIVPILLLCLKRTVADPSPLVRSATAISLASVYEIDTATKKQVIEYLTKLLSDSDSTVVSSAIKTFYKLKNTLGDSNQRIWQPIHGNFRRFCSIIGELDEWSQSFLIDILTEYCRIFLPVPHLKLKDGSDTVIDLPSKYNEIPFPLYDIRFDKDLQLFLDSLRPLVYSRSEVVLLSIAKAVYSTAPPLTFKELNIGPALTKIASSTSFKSSNISYYAMQLIVTISRDDPSIFNSHYKKFYVYPTDSLPISKLKLEVLLSLANENNIRYILEEFKYYALRSENKILSSESIKAIGRCAQLSPEWYDYIFKWCLSQIKITTGTALNELLTVVRYMIQQKTDSSKHGHNDSNERIITTIYKLSLILTDKKVALESKAKASIIWMIGEFTDIANNSIGPDVIRQLINRFSYQLLIVRYQILVLATKLYTYELNRLKNENIEDVDDLLKDNRIFQMFQYVLQLSKYDNSYDIRDRARLFNVLLNNGVGKSELASLFLQVPKQIPVVVGVNADGNSGSNILNDYIQVNDWSDQLNLPDSKIRKEVEVQLNKLSMKGLSSISSNGVNHGVNHGINRTGSPLSDHGISSETYHKMKASEPKSRQPYQLQSLEDFFGNEEEAKGDDEDEEEDDDEDESEFESSDDSEVESSEAEEDELEEESRATETNGLLGRKA